MCGIIAYFGNEKTENMNEKRELFLKLSKLIRHRGPDWNGIYEDYKNKVFIGHERLSIVSPESGSQPIISDDNLQVLSVNGEIYNYKELYNNTLLNKYTCSSKSDCEVIMHLYREFGKDTAKMLDGIYGFVLYNQVSGEVYIARDPIGIIPLYIGWNSTGEFMVASECKSLVEVCNRIIVFPPGHSLTFNVKSLPTEETISFNKFYNPLFRDTEKTFERIENDEDIEATTKKIRESLEVAVEKRLMADVPFGVLLSGGLDSSLIASITSRLIKEKPINSWSNNLHSFSIGLKGAPDLIAAKKVADFLGTVHHEFHFTVTEGIDAIRDLIWHLETYDVTTIRASTPMYLLSRKVKSLGIKMVLSGEGADEVFGGYLYFHQAPTDEEFHKECISRVDNLHHFDCLRANKSTMAWGVEARVPFLDQSFLNTVMTIDPKVKMRDSREKWGLRKAFDTPENPYLPEDILWRQKEQFSDGVGYSWIDSLKSYAESMVSDIEFQARKSEDSHLRTHEAVWYKNIYDELFKTELPIKRWIPRTDWNGVGYDPSGRAQQIHENSC
jgi:asparagine synthase (glutamine-hydrolysing)